MLLLQLKELRIGANVTQQQLADLLGVSRTTYTRYENGERAPSLSLLKKLADYFNTTIDVLVGGAASSSLDLQIVTRISALSIEDKQNLIRYLDFMSKRNGS